MSIVRTELTLKNPDDKVLVQNGYIKESEIRQMTVNALVDTGALFLVINKEIKEKLGLRVIGKESGTLADGTKSFYDKAGPIEIWWKDRCIHQDALVLPEADEVLLGALPLEAMDLTINPRKEELIGAHGDMIVHRI
jgi:clan AA aspartic protease